MPAVTRAAARRLAAKQAGQEVHQHEPPVQEPPSSSKTPVARRSTTRRQKRSVSPSPRATKRAKTESSGKKSKAPVTDNAEVLVSASQVSDNVITKEGGLSNRIKGEDTSPPAFAPKSSVHRDRRDQPPEVSQTIRGSRVRSPKRSTNQTLSRSTQKASGNNLTITALQRSDTTTPGADSNKRLSIPNPTSASVRIPPSTPIASLPADPTSFIPLPDLSTTYTPEGAPHVDLLYTTAHTNPDSGLVVEGSQINSDPDTPHHRSSIISSSDLEPIRHIGISTHTISKVPPKVYYPPDRQLNHRPELVSTTGSESSEWGPISDGENMPVTIHFGKFGKQISVWGRRESQLTMQGTRRSPRMYEALSPEEVRAYYKALAERERALEAGMDGLDDEIEERLRNLSENPILIMRDDAANDGNVVQGIGTEESAVITLSGNTQQAFRSQLEASKSRVGRPHGTHWYQNSSIADSIPIKRPHTSQRTPAAPSRIFKRPTSRPPSLPASAFRLQPAPNSSSLPRSSSTPPLSTTLPTSLPTLSPWISSSSPSRSTNHSLAPFTSQFQISPLSTRHARTCLPQISPRHDFDPSNPSSQPPIRSPSRSGLVRWVLPQAIPGAPVHLVPRHVFSALANALTDPGVGDKKLGGDGRSAGRMRYVASTRRRSPRIWAKQRALYSSLAEATKPEWDRKIGTEREEIRQGMECADDELERDNRCVNEDNNSEEGDGDIERLERRQSFIDELRHGEFDIDPTDVAGLRDPNMWSSWSDRDGPTDDTDKEQIVHDEAPWRDTEASQKTEIQVLRVAAQSQDQHTRPETHPVPSSDRLSVSYRASVAPMGTYWESHAPPNSSIDGALVNEMVARKLSLRVGMLRDQFFQRCQHNDVQTAKEAQGLDRPSGVEWASLVPTAPKLKSMSLGTEDQISDWEGLDGVAQTHVMEMKANGSGGDKHGRNLGEEREIASETTVTGGDDANDEEQEYAKEARLEVEQCIGEIVEEVVRGSRTISTIPGRNTISPRSSRILSPTWSDSTDSSLEAALQEDPLQIASRTVPGDTPRSTPVVVKPSSTKSSVSNLFNSILRRPSSRGSTPSLVSVSTDQVTMPPPLSGAALTPSFTQELAGSLTPWHSPEPTFHLHPDQVLPSIESPTPVRTPTAVATDHVPDADAESLCGPLTCEPFVSGELEPLLDSITPPLLAQIPPGEASTVGNGTARDGREDAPTPVEQGERDKVEAYLARKRELEEELDLIESSTKSSGRSGVVTKVRGPSFSEAFRDGWESE